MTADLPLISVVIPTRDRPHLLAIALECYRQQTYPHRELIVVDDGDRFPVDEAAVNAVGGRLLRVEPGLPLGAKLNVGIEASGGRFIQKMDDDDFYAATFIETMYRQVQESWRVVARPTMAILMGFLFFDVARWEVRRSLPENAPGATLFFGRDDWEDHPFRGVPRDEDVWFYQDQIRLGGACVTVDAPETFLAVRHAGSAGNRGHTWTRQLDGTRLETYLLDLPLHEGGPEALLPAWALERYRTLRAEIVAAQDAQPAEETSPPRPPSPARRGGSRTEPSPARYCEEEGGLAASEILTRLAEPDQPPATYGALLDAAETIISGGDGAFDLDGVAALAVCPHLYEFRTRLLHDLIEPALLARPELVTVRHLDQLAGRYGRHPSFLYLLASLTDHPTVHGEVRAVAVAGTIGQFPLRDDVAARLGREGASALIVSLPDESGAATTDPARAAASLDAAALLLGRLLEGHPGLRVTLLTAAALHPEHSRLRIVSAHDPAAVSRVLAERFDAVFQFASGAVPPSPGSLEAGVSERVRVYIAERRPGIVAGLLPRRGQFCCHQLDLDGRPYAETLSLTVPRADRQLGGIDRLLAHLGLPLHQSTPPAFSPLLAGEGLGVRSCLAGEGPGVNSPRILILTPLKNATSFLDGYIERLYTLTYPHAAISLGFLEGDSSDATFEAVERHLPSLRAEFRRVGLWKRDFGYQSPEGVHRGAAPIQIERRSVLARSRNHLLSHALDDEDWVLWLDVDVVSYPDDLVQRLLAPGKELVQPHCVLDPGGPTFDTNGWRDFGRLHLDDLRAEGQLVELDAVGATVLLVRADLHRDGLVFPAFLYGRENPWMRPGRGEIETEGLGMMARDMGYRAWGLPHLEVIHARH